MFVLHGLIGLLDHSRRTGHAPKGSSASELTRGRPGNRRGDHGATSVEYALMVTFIAVVIVVSVAVFGHNVSDLFEVPSSVFAP